MSNNQQQNGRRANMSSAGEGTSRRIDHPSNSRSPNEQRRHSEMQRPSQPHPAYSHPAMHQQMQSPYPPPPQQQLNQHFYPPHPVYPRTSSPNMVNPYHANQLPYPLLEINPYNAGPSRLHEMRNNQMSGGIPPGFTSLQPLPTHHMQSLERAQPQPTMTALPAHYSPSVAKQIPKAPVTEKRRRSDDLQSANHEVEAGLALANMGAMGTAGEIVKAENGEGVTASPVKRRGGKKAKADLEEVPAGQVQAKKSCAECRRMKAKCDRVFPCSNCRKRGCALACPDQDLSCMQGKRLVLASTEQLHERITELEAALAQAHRTNANSSPHPLLKADHPDGGGAADASPHGRNSVKTETDEVRTLSPAQRSSSNGSYTLRTPVLQMDSIVERNQGRMAVESLLIDESQVGAEAKKEDDWAGENAAPALIIGNAGAVSQDSIDRQAILHRLQGIVRVLPDRETTRQQANRFWKESTWYQNILRRDEFESIYEPAMYEPTPSNPLTPHKLACVLMLLTLDTYMDVRGSHENPLVGEYWEGVQRCFDTSFGWGASVAGVQALGLASLFVGFGWRGAGASNFYWLRLMTSAAQQLGLHKDPNPVMPAAEQTFRRRVFHEMYTLDCLMSINHGQRTAIPHENIETKYPDDGMPLCRLKYMYMGHVKSKVIEIGCAAESVSKEDLAQRVMGLAKVLDRYSMEAQPDMHCPAITGSALPPVPAPWDQATVDVASLTRSTTSMCHLKSMMFLHRPSLRRLIARLREAQQAGVKASLSDVERDCAQQTYLASTSIIAVSGFIAKYEPRLAARLWSTWVQTFSAAVSLAALAIWCGPHMEEGFVKRAYEEMRGGCDMIREHGCSRAQGVLALLPILCSLVENRYPSLTGSDRPTSTAVQQGEDMIFVLLGGQADFTPAPTTSSTPPIAAVPVPVFQPIPNPTNPAPEPARSINPEPTIAWNDQFSIGPLDQLPITWLQPPTTSAYTNAPSTARQPLGSDMGMGNQQEWLNGADPAEVWARLQTFYEPAVALPFWAGTGGVPGAGMGMGMYDQGVSVGWGSEDGQF